MATAEVQRRYMANKKTIKIVASKEEYDVIKERAEELGKPVATYCKELVLQDACLWKGKPNG